MVCRKGRFCEIRQESGPVEISIYTVDYDPKATGRLRLDISGRAIVFNLIERALDQKPVKLDSIVGNDIY